jgi:hypothetical protein
MYALDKKTQIVFTNGQLPVLATISITWAFKWAKVL